MNTTLRSRHPLAQVVHKYRAAQLKYEYVNMRGLPAPLNVVSLTLSLLGALARKCRCLGRRDGERVELPSISEAWLNILKAVRTKQAKLDAEEDEAVEAGVRRLGERLDLMSKQLERLRGLDRLKELERAVERLGARLGKGKAGAKPKGGAEEAEAEEEDDDEFEEEEDEEFTDDDDDEEEEESR